MAARPDAPPPHEAEQDGAVISAAMREAVGQVTVLQAVLLAATWSWGHWERGTWVPSGLRHRTDRVAEPPPQGREHAPQLPICAGGQRWCVRSRRQQASIEDRVRLSPMLEGARAMPSVHLPSILVGAANSNGRGAPVGMH
jgi:hypothetical protein